MKSRQALIKSVFGILALSGYSVADQPVHCKYLTIPILTSTLGYEDNVIGDWTFEITQKSTLPNLFKSEEVCSHQLPNK